MLSFLLVYSLIPGLVALGIFFTFEKYIYTFFEHVIIPLFTKLSVHILSSLRTGLNIIKNNVIYSIDHINKIISQIEDVIVSIEVKYSKKLFNKIKMSVKVYTMENGTLKEVNGSGTLDMDNLPEKVRRRLASENVIIEDHLNDFNKMMRTKC